MNFGPINGTLIASIIEEVTLDGTPIRIEVTHLGENSESPIFFVFADTEDPGTLADPTIEGERCEAVAPGQRLALPVRRTPESTLKKVVVKLISADDVGFSVAVR